MHRTSGLRFRDLRVRNSDPRPISEIRRHVWPRRHKDTEKNTLPVTRSTRRRAAAGEARPAVQRHYEMPTLVCLRADFKPLKRSQTNLTLTGCCFTRTLTPTVFFLDACD